MFDEVFSTMNPLIEVLKDLCNGILKFLTPILLCVALYILIASIYYILHHRNQEKKNPQEKQTNDFVLVCKSLGKSIWNVIKSLPKIIVFIVILFVMNILLSIGLQFTKYMDNQNKIEQLSSVVKNLSRCDDIVKITIDRKETQWDKSVTLYYTLHILDIQGNEITKQMFETEGQEIWIDSININFEYSKIESGTVMNLAYPYRVYSEKTAPNNGENITSMFNEQNIPVIFLLNDDLYGISENDYLLRLKELLEIVNDKDKSNEYGIRSVQGSAIHFTPEEGDVYLIRSDAVGGLSLHEQRF